MSALYEDFMKTEGVWRNSLVYKTIKRKSRSGHRAVRKWLTRSQMLQVFGCADIVESIISRKMGDRELAATEIRPHPDAPGIVRQLCVLHDVKHAFSKSFGIE